MCWLPVNWQITELLVLSALCYIAMYLWYSIDQWSVKWDGCVLLFALGIPGWSMCLWRCSLIAAQLMIYFSMKREPTEKSLNWCIRSCEAGFWPGDMRWAKNQRVILTVTHHLTTTTMPELYNCCDNVAYFLLKANQRHYIASGWWEEDKEMKVRSHKNAPGVLVGGWRADRTETF